VQLVVAFHVAWQYLRGVIVDKSSWQILRDNEVQRVVSLSIFVRSVISCDYETKIFIHEKFFWIKIFVSVEYLDTLLIKGKGPFFPRLKVCPNTRRRRNFLFWKFFWIKIFVSVEYLHTLLIQGKGPFFPRLKVCPNTRRRRNFLFNSHTLPIFM
jgi:hypothetical protein